jgi:hypothetical protein
MRIRGSIGSLWSVLERRGALRKGDDLVMGTTAEMIDVPEREATTFGERP